jgi:hypothetical protein
VFRTLDAILRGLDRRPADGAAAHWALILAWTLGLGSLYGAAMGCYALDPRQVWFSALKVPLLMGISTLVCLPSFYAINAVLGLGEDLKVACRAVFYSQAVFAICLASLAPIIVMIYASTSYYTFAKVANGGIFLLATLGSQVKLWSLYRPLLEKNRNHRHACVLWLLSHIFVAIQMAWILRPFIGSPGLEPQLFRDGAWSNAYVEVGRLLLHFYQGR